MLAGNLSRVVSRRFSTTSKRLCQWERPADAFPNDIRKKVKMTIGYTVFITTGFGYPFLAVYKQSTK